MQCICSRQDKVHSRAELLNVLYRNIHISVSLYSLSTFSSFFLSAFFPLVLFSSNSACEWVDIDYGILHDNCRAIYPEVSTTNILIVAFITILLTSAVSSTCYDTIFHYLLLPASRMYGKTEGSFMGTSICMHHT